MKKLFPIILLFFILAGCALAGPGATTPPATTEPTTAPSTVPTTVPITEAPTEPAAPPTTEPTTTPTTEPTTVPTTEAPTEPTDPPLGNFTSEDVALFDGLFQQAFVPGGPSPVNYYNRIMHIHDFTDPSQIDVRQVFYDQDIDENWELTEAEKAFLGKQERVDLNLDVVRVSSEKVDRVLRECFGLSLEDMKESDAWVYFPETDCYYHSKGDTHMIPFKIQGGTWLENGLVEIYYCSFGMMNMTITLQQTDSGYHIVANIFNGYV